MRHVTDTLDSCVAALPPPPFPFLSRAVIAPVPGLKPDGTDDLERLVAHTATLFLEEGSRRSTHESTCLHREPTP